MNKAEKEYNRLLWLHLNNVTEWVPPGIYEKIVSVGLYKEKAYYCKKCKRRAYSQVHINEKKG